MFIIRIAFPCAHRPEKVVTFEWPFKGATSDLSWETLITKLCEHTRMKKGKFYVSWNDGTEYCTISTTESLREAVNQMRINRPDSTPLLYVSPVVPPEEKKLGGFFGGCAPEDLPRDFREYVDADTNEGRADYMQSNEYGPLELVCNQCKLVDWRGDKFSCVVCPRVVLCGTCYQSGFHAQHPVLITRDCTGYPSAILQAVRVVASNIVSGASDDESDLSNDADCESRPSSKRTSVCKPIIDPKPEDPKVVAAIQKLRAMGFSQDYNRLSRLAVEENGDVNSMIEKLME
ncbi:unnamed protein product [Echinostoma caproni]|uniref:UBA domain-containing protein n=1 Tax=Echinostoma caproni TaxID=27848 RepID=A0A183AKN4_9TREM|nr:unnamed protein product [Echinostoma caproni]